MMATNDLAQIRRELDMARSDLANHARIITDFTERFDTIYRWQAKKDVDDGRAEEREKQMVSKLDSVLSLGKALLLTSLSGIILAVIAVVTDRF